MELDLDKLIYLDSEFISRKYEELKDYNPSTQITKSEGFKGGISAGFLSAGANTQETRTFMISSHKMLKELWDTLKSLYKTFDETSFQNYKGTEITWLSGDLTIAEWSSQRQEKGYEFYQLDHHNKKRTAFLTHREYFSAGFDEVFNASVALKGNIGIPVICLARIMWHVDQAENYTACPYIIMEVGS